MSAEQLFNLKAGDLVYHPFLCEEYRVWAVDAERGMITIHDVGTRGRAARKNYHYRYLEMI